MEKYLEWSVGTRLINQFRMKKFIMQSTFAGKSTVPIRHQQKYLRCRIIALPAGGILRVAGVKMVSSRFVRSIAGNIVCRREEEQKVRVTTSILILLKPELTASTSVLKKVFGKETLELIFICRFLSLPMPGCSSTSRQSSSVRHHREQGWSMKKLVRHSLNQHLLIACNPILSFRKSHGSYLRRLLLHLV